MGSESCPAHSGNTSHALQKAHNKNGTRPGRIVIMEELDVRTLEERCINTIRLLAADMVEKARSGHPGMPLGAAAIAYVLWYTFLRHNPANPAWPNRDRFILSAGHGCALLYALLHLTGHDLSLEDLKQFRQLGSKTPGHPEYGVTPGVEVTTGPLGQGFANGVGMAIAESYLAEFFNRPEFSIVDYYIYGICSDGDLMEGIASEAASIAGHLQLGKIIYFYDNNNISIEGSTGLAFTEKVGQRFASYGWHVQEIDGNDVRQIETAIVQAQREKRLPSLIIAKTHIAYGSPNKQDTAEAHGSPLGEEEIRLMKRNAGFPQEKSFFIPKDVHNHFRRVSQQGIEAEKNWKDFFKRYAERYPDLAAQWTRSQKKEFSREWESNLPEFEKGKLIATRKASGQLLNSIASKNPMLVGGAADLAPSTMSHLKGFCDFGPGRSGCPNFHFGVREHAMGAILNGIALSGKLIPYGATFLIFSDYLRPSLRLAALMDNAVIFIFTHDSIALGEDGPTHQPVEHLASLRAIPNMTVIRPCDALETIGAWKVILERKKPVCLVLCRQDVPVLRAELSAISDRVAKGAYILSDPDDNLPHGVLIATGSEVHLALEAAQSLSLQGIRVRVVSMPSWELFLEQDREYQNTILPPEIPARLAVEAGSALGWRQFVGDHGDVVSVDTFGASGASKNVLEKYGFTVKNIIARTRAVIQKVSV